MPYSVWKQCYRNRRCEMNWWEGSRRSITGFAYTLWLAVNTITSKCLDRVYSTRRACGRMLTPAVHFSPLGSLTGTWISHLAADYSLQCIKVSSRSKTKVFLSLYLMLLLRTNFETYQSSGFFILFMKFIAASDCKTCSNTGLLGEGFSSCPM